MGAPRHVRLRLVALGPLRERWRNRSETAATAARSAAELHAVLEAAQRPPPSRLAGGLTSSHASVKGLEQVLGGIVSSSFRVSRWLAVALWAALLLPACGHEGNCAALCLRSATFVYASPRAGRHFEVSLSPQGVSSLLLGPGAVAASRVGGTDRAWARRLHTWLGAPS